VIIVYENGELRSYIINQGSEHGFRTSDKKWLRVVLKQKN